VDTVPKGDAVPAVWAAIMLAMLCYPSERKDRGNGKRWTMTRRLEAALGRSSKIDLCIESRRQEN